MGILFHLVFLSVQILFVLSGQRNIEAKLSAPDLIKGHGYPSEVHKITTEDGYILESHRIANPGKQPVILTHGVLDASITYVIMGPKRSLGYILHDLNYDVWLLNARGNDYSTGHIKYHRDGTQRERKKYWNFSWHEIGKYDLAASIDYVLKNTSYSKVHFLGHSEGTTSYFVLTSERPEYNDKILLMVAMAPPVFMEHMENSLIPFLTRFVTVIETLVEWFGVDQVSRELHDRLVGLQNTFFCSWDVIRDTQLCNHNFSPYAGNLTQHISRTILPILSAYIPAGSSFKAIRHYWQLIRTPRFCQFDHGIENNRKIYNRSTPPDYSLKNCTAPVALIYSDHDTFTAAKDVVRLSHELPNLMTIKRVEDDTFNHLDFVWAMDAKELVYDFIIDWMKIREEEAQQRR